MKLNATLIRDVILIRGGSAVKITEHIAVVIDWPDDPFDSFHAGDDHNETRGEWRILKTEQPDAPGKLTWTVKPVDTSMNLPIRI